jgi:hypothetical protein
LALINGTQASTALALAGLFRAHRAAQAALDHRRALHRCRHGLLCAVPPDIHTLRGHKGQIDGRGLCADCSQAPSSARAIWKATSACRIPIASAASRRSTAPASICCVMAGRTLEIEANAVTDNPLVLSDNSVVSGGNFHAEPVAFAADQIALAVCEIGAIAQRRIALLVDPALSFGLPAFLAKKPGLNSGLMIAEVTSAALMSENKQMAHPASVDSTPTSANQEDHVSMACHGARRLLQMTDNLFCHHRHRGADRRTGRRIPRAADTSPELRKAIATLRAVVPTLEEDRYMAPDLARLPAPGGWDLAPPCPSRHPALLEGDMSPSKSSQGTSPVILAFPHTGTDVPSDIWSRLNDNGRILADTDWHIQQLYAGLLPDATTVRATFHRYVHRRQPRSGRRQPLSRPEHDGSVPETDFDGIADLERRRGADQGDIADRLSASTSPIMRRLPPRSNA